MKAQLRGKDYIGIHNGEKKGKQFSAPGKENVKAARKLARRKKIDSEHGPSKGKHIHTIPGSMKKGGGY